MAGSGSLTRRPLPLRPGPYLCQTNSPLYRKASASLMSVRRKIGGIRAHDNKCWRHQPGPRGT
ncbi:hypothetical protein Ga0080559_TMP3207 [Salipiger profundus]|uniref:Uncharacterized protein n=1 Tax=Salipiger profundus TaxID=1229727 RepID=A0A1U7D7A4_9RHOB|nr:hypothetical protein Ga0080559_TMP3207 [Salipiger profundus]